MAIRRTNGTKVSRKQMKKVIMSANNWNEEQYRKQYDLFKNKLRAYETYKGVRMGLSRERIKETWQSPQEVLYRAAKAKKREGSEYKPSLEMQRIQAFSAVSITKGFTLAEDKESVYSRKRSETFASTTERAFKNFINQVPKAKEIMEKVKDPVLREEALKDLAEYVHAKQKPSGEIESGETFGSDEYAEDYNIAQWF